MNRYKVAITAPLFWDDQRSIDDILDIMADQMRCFMNQVSITGFDEDRIVQVILPVIADTSWHAADIAFTIWTMSLLNMEDVESDDSALDVHIEPAKRELFGLSAA